MRGALKLRGGRRERGSVAVEAAAVVLLLVIFLAVPLFLARVLWCYGVAQKAAYDGARALAAAPRAEMLVAGGGMIESAPGSELARSIVRAEMQQIMSVIDASTIDVQCDFVSCGLVLPQTVRVVVRIRLRDHIFPVITEFLYWTVDKDAMDLRVDVTMNYAGR